MQVHLREKVYLVETKLNIPGFKCNKTDVQGIFPVERGAYLLGNSYSPVAVAIPKPDHRLARVAIEAGAAIAGFVRTANVGLEKIISNIVGNPNIRYLLLFGKEVEGYMPGRTLLALYENGVDNSGKVVGGLGMTPYIRNIPREVVDRFRDQLIYVINLLGYTDEQILKEIVKATLQEPDNAKTLIVNNKRYLLYDRGAYSHSPIVYPITQKLIKKGLYEILTPLSTCINSPTISAAYFLLLDAIINAGQELRDERGEKIRELLNVQIHISNPLRDIIPKGYRPTLWLKSDEEVKRYLEKLGKCSFMGNKTFVYEEGIFKFVPATTKYTLGSRLTNFHNLNQIEITLKALKNAIKNEMQTRRIIITLVDPTTDLSEDTQETEIPCLTQYIIYPRKVDHEWKLHAVLSIRSLDALKAFVADAYTGICLLKFFAEQCNVQLGTFTMNLGSAHIYISDIASGAIKKEMKGGD